MKVITVLGEIDSGKLGIVDPHNHAVVDIRCFFNQSADTEKKKLSEEKVSIKNLDILSRNPYAVKDNMWLEDLKTAELELLKFKYAGGGTVIDATSIGMGRDPEALKAVSKKTGLNILMGCGYYVHDTHSADLKKMSIKNIKNEIIDDISKGVGKTGIRAGVIGEIGTSEIIYPAEEKVLEASAQAQKETGLPILIHAFPWERHALKVLDILENNGAELSKVYISHIDVDIDIDYCIRIAERGAFLGFDSFGKEYFIDKKDRGSMGLFATDLERIKAIKELIGRGFLSRILMTTDIVFKTSLHAYGGWGYDHVLNHISPIMEEHGIGKEQIQTILKKNPLSLLS